MSGFEKKKKKKKKKQDDEAPRKRSDLDHESADFFSRAHKVRVSSSASLS